MRFLFGSLLMPLPVVGSRIGCRRPAQTTRVKPPDNSAERIWWQAGQAIT